MRRLRMMIGLLFGAILVATGACGNGSSEPAKTSSSPAPAAFPTGSSTHTLEFRGTQRDFAVFVPPDLPARRPVPLVVMLHGGFGSAAQAESDYGWDLVASVGRFVVAYPDGLHRSWDAGGGCCGQPGRTGVDDVGFITQVVKSVQSHEHVDPSRIFATGMSAGALMDYRLACSTDVFAAIGPVAGTLQGPCPHPERVSVIHVHGSADTRVPYGGGPGSGVGGVDGLSVPAVNEMWRRVDGCSDPSVTAAGPVTTSVAACPGGLGVELITVAGAGHQWPGSRNHPVVQRLLDLDPPSTALDATQTIWRFFSAHPKPTS